MRLSRYEVIFDSKVVGSHGGAIVAVLDEDNLDGSIECLSRCMSGSSYPAVSISKVS